MNHDHYFKQNGFLRCTLCGETFDIPVLAVVKTAILNTVAFQSEGKSVLSSKNKQTSRKHNGNHMLLGENTKETNPRPIHYRGNGKNRNIRAKDSQSSTIFSEKEIHTTSLGQTKPIIIRSTKKYLEGGKDVL